MKTALLIICIALIPFQIFGQEMYKWKDIENITFYDLSNQQFSCDINSINQIPTELKSVFCTSPEIIDLFDHFTKCPFDIGTEYCYFFNVRFNNGEEILFQYFPEIYVIVDKRKDMWVNQLQFNESAKIKLDSFVKSCKECLQDPQCKYIK